MARTKPKTLVIVESPTKARTISQFLGASFDIESSFGHMRDLPKSKLGIDEVTLEPSYIIPIKARKNVTALKKKAKKATEIILATDEDREGEAIAWHLAQVLEMPEENRKRIVFHEITKKAIEEALNHPRDIDLKLVNAQQARRVLDRLVGYKLSPFLWKKVARGLSAGRVQSVAVRLIVDREAEINAFKKDEYWTIDGSFRPTNAEDLIVGELTVIDGTTLEKFSIPTEQKAKDVADDATSGDARIVSVTTKEEAKKAPAPFTTSTLQQTAGQRLGYSAKQTMMLAQRLYEQGFITYMRTDSLNISREAITATFEYIEKNLPKEYMPQAPRIFKTKSKGAQEAHEAIRPTDIFRTPESLKERVEDQKEWKLYDLIWRRFLASQLPNATVAHTKADIAVTTKGHEYIFRASGSRMVFDGYLSIYPMKFAEHILPPLADQEKLSIVSIDPLQHFTEPPPRFNEASLIKALEKFGIGRPSTYAPTISTIQDRGYVEKDEQKRLRPTETANIVNKLLVENFPQIVDIDFTAHMEQEFDEIAEGTREWKPIIREFYEPFAKLLEEKYETVVSQKVEEKTDEICEKCGKPMVIKRGRFGKFIACSGFPECKTTKRIPDPALANLQCPTCLLSPERKDTPGGIVRRKSKRGRYFFGCSRWPECDFISWTLPKAPNAETEAIIEQPAELESPQEEA
jgi:DNA topoisomerase-1